jgi:uncharacterized membrane protein YoaK (UPF0700 family)
LRTLLRLQFTLLTASAALAIWLGPFASADQLPALVTGLTLVAAMATQNATHRLQLPSAPPSTVMTMTTTQIMLDVAEIVYGAPGEAEVAIRGRLKRLIVSVVMFALGCGGAALLYARLGVWCFLLPPLLGLTAARLAADPSRA